VKDARQLFGQPGSILHLVKQLRRKTFPGQDTENFNHTNSTLKLLYERFERTCVTFPRTLFVPVESPEEEIARDVPAFLNASNFDTLRWRYRTSKGHGFPKSILDLSRVRVEDFNSDGGPHYPLFSVCPRVNQNFRYDEAPIVVHHYLGSWESYSCRADARDQARDSRHNRATWAKFSELEAGVPPNDQVRPWIRGFVNLVGEHEVRALLKGAGQLSKSMCKVDSGDGVGSR